MRGAWLGILVCWGLQAATLPAGTELHLRLQARVSSATAKAGDPVEALLIRPVLAADDVVLAGGASLRGKVSAAQPAKADQRAKLGLRFEELTAAPGVTLKLAARVKAIDNARETVDDAGMIVGIAGAETLSSRMDRGIERLAERYKGLSELLGATKGALVKEVNPEIAYEPGVEFELVLTAPVTVTSAAKPLAVEAVPDEDALVKMTRAQPFRAYASNPPRPSDMTNLMYLGSQQEIEAAFTAAGWSTAAELNHQTALETFRAVAEQRGYKEAPMSILLLDGQKPDLVFQKQNNTFAMRHHLRIWKRSVTFSGRQVWVCAATHDIGIDFSAEHRTFIHKIDPQIDAERAKVVNDLLLTGKVKGLSLVPRPDVPQHSQNATGDNLETDGAIAVLMF
jgi:hypothetical protein